MVLPSSCYSALTAGMAALQLFYNTSTGLWHKEWWQSANALETTIDYAQLTKSRTYDKTIANTFNKHQHTKFLNRWFIDDDGWWALTWIKAYDLTGEQRYLNMAKTIFNDMKRRWDSTCGGGLWWTKNNPDYKNAITNSLFLSVAAKLHARTPNDYGKGSYLDWAKRSWKWIKQSGMINAKNLVNDGLNRQCRNNGQPTWTYNQGVLIGGLVELYKSTKDVALLRQADAIANATITNSKLAPKGILREPCEPDCGKDGAQFKGVFMRNLSALYRVSPKSSYRAFILRNADTIWTQNRNHKHQFGLIWAGPFDAADSTRQSSAIDALNAAVAIQRPTQQCETAWSKTEWEAAR